MSEKTIEDFPVIELDMTDEEQNKIVGLFVRNNMRPESIDVFESYPPEEIKDALYHATFNDMAVECVEHGIKELKENDEEEDVT